LKPLKLGSVEQNKVSSCHHQKAVVNITEFAIFRPGDISHSKVLKLLG